MANNKVSKMRIRDVDYDISALANNVSFSSGDTFDSGSIGKIVKSLVCSVNEMLEKGVFSSGLTYSSLTY
jgi:hypothetical protein